MQRVRCAWHMPSFPVDGSAGSQFVEHIHQTMRRLPPAIESVWVDDHMMPWAKWQPNDTPYLECLTTMAVFAAAYPRLHFAAGVFCQSYRNPGLLAKTVANLQLLTGGRIIFGIGAGWMEEEYDAYDFEFPSPRIRLAQLEEAIQVTQRLWTDSPASFEGTYYRVENAFCEPRPDPLPPLLIGGGGEQRTLRLVAKYADWWNLSGGTPETFAHKLAVLHEHCAAIGRDPSAIVKTWSTDGIALAASEAEARRIAGASPFTGNIIVGTPAQVAEQLQRYADVGVEYLVVRLLDFPATAGIELFAEEVLPRLHLPAPGT
ncbi:MAG TPA: LLM class flavin-dependent oxidoreductase [Roseiflexaceae bacterium]|nr:LLM class flavin-dependent oxidoreductase [Roseiflexaceae bacterium]